MGMYTELNCAFKLLEDVPEQIVNTLKFMADASSNEPSEVPTHELFAETRWQYMLNCDSYYFDGDAHSTIRLDDIDNRYYVTIRCNLKNYNKEIEKFIDWITPFIDMMEGDFIGYTRYEETEVPTLIYHPNKFFRPKVPIAAQ